MALAVQFDDFLWFAEGWAVVLGTPYIVADAALVALVPSRLGRVCAGATRQQMVLASQVTACKTPPSPCILVPLLCLFLINPMRVSNSNSLPPLGIAPRAWILNKPLLRYSSRLSGAVLGGGGALLLQGLDCVGATRQRVGLTFSERLNYSPPPPPPPQLPTAVIHSSSSLLFKID